MGDGSEGKVVAVRGRRGEDGYIKGNEEGKGRKPRGSNGEGGGRREAVRVRGKRGEKLLL